MLDASSISLLFQAGLTKFDRSSKIDTAVHVGVTTLVAALNYFHALAEIAGGVLVGSSVVYLGLVCCASTEASSLCQGTPGLTMMRTLRSVAWQTDLI